MERKKKREGDKQKKKNKDNVESLKERHQRWWTIATRPLPYEVSGFHRFIILETKLTMAEAGWSGSNSANRWLTLSVVLPCFLATNPKSLEDGKNVSMQCILKPSEQCSKSELTLLIHLLLLPIYGRKTEVFPYNEVIISICCYSLWKNNPYFLSWGSKSQKVTVLRG